MLVSKLFASHEALVYAIYEQFIYSLRFKINEGVFCSLVYYIQKYINLYI